MLSTTTSSSSRFHTFKTIYSCGERNITQILAQFSTVLFKFLSSYNKCNTSVTLTFVL